VSATAERQTGHSCPMCGGTSRRAFDAADRNRRVTFERFTYQRCNVCSTFFIADIPQDLDRYYRGGYYPFDEAGQPLWRSNPQRLLAESFRVRLLQSYVHSGRLIDIGAGSGGFSAAAQDAGFDVTAIEMDSQCCDYLERELGVTVVRSDTPIASLASLPPAKVIALWHVLEHLPAPLEMLEEASRKLEDGGILAIGVPNPRSLQFRLLRTRWAHLDAPRHLSLPTPEILGQAAADLGMKRMTSTTTDPDGLECNLFGWLNGIRLRPASGPPSKLQLHLAGAATRAMAPLERSALRGSAATLVFRKEPPGQ
jgi:SAM-dependent methyltransferase